MNKKKGFRLSRVVLVCLLLCLCLGFAACEGQNVTETTVGGATETQPPVTYSLEIATEGGSVLSDVTVYVYADSSLADLVAVVKTDKEGKTEFTYGASDSYVAVLSGVPQGYIVDEQYPITGEKTSILLKAELVEGELDSVVYKLGDVMQDFTFTGTDGTEYKLSELLSNKKAVVLNFWYTNCGPCKQEFPYLQEAYDAYKDVLEVLAIDPVETDNALIQTFAEELGLTFPIGAGDPAWKNAMKIMGYPTTVVIDRYGTVALYHSGGIPDDQKFKDIFAFFTADDYVQTVVENAEDLFVTEPDSETVENPVDISGQFSFQLTLEAGKMHYVYVHKMKNVWLQANNGDVYVEYGGKKFTASNGSVGLMISAPSTFEPAQVGFCNTGDETVTFTVTLSNQAGSYENPYALQLGEFTVSEAAGNDQGVYFTYTASQDGYFSLQCLSVSPSVDFDVSVMNLTTSSMHNLSTESEIDSETGKQAVTMAMNKDESVRITIGTLPDSSNNYPAATFKMLAKFDAGEVEDVVVVERLTYAVTVTDENRNPLPNVNISLTDSQKSKVTMATDENGVATVWIPKDVYAGSIIVPAGYESKTVQFELTPEIPYVSLKLDTVVEEKKYDYTVYVKDDTGAPMSGVMVILGNSVGSTNDQGAYTMTAVKGDYSVMVMVPAGYTSTAMNYSFPENETNLTVTLNKQNEELGGVTGGDIGGSTAGSGGGTGSVGGNTGGNQGGASGGNTGGSGSSGGNTGGNQGGASGGNQGGSGSSGGSTGGNQGGASGGNTGGSGSSGGSTDGGNIGGAAGGSTGGNQGVEDTRVNYNITIVDAAGNAQPGIEVKVMDASGKEVHAAHTDGNNKIVVRLKAGNYYVNLKASSGTTLLYNVQDTILTANKTETTIAVAADISGATHESTWWGNYYIIYTGSTQLDLSKNVNQATEEALNGNWMYMFYPSVSGIYTCTVSEGAKLTNYGTVVLNPGDSTDENGYFEIKIGDSQFANDNQPAILLGVEATAVDGPVYITVSRTGDAPAELPVVKYEPATEPKLFNSSESGTITYVDLEGTATLQKRADGYYLNGKKLYVNIGKEAPYVTMSNMMGLSYDSTTGAWTAGSMGTGLKGLAYELVDDVLQPVAVNDYTDCMWSYVKACDPLNGLYPLNDDLITMFQNAGEYLGWWNAAGYNYLFEDISNLNTDIAWMFACCYFN